MSKILPSDGAHYGVSFAEYREWPALNSSSISECIEHDGSMSHLRQAMLGGESDTPSLLLGRLAHAATLGEPDFNRLYWVYRPEPGEKVTEAGLPPQNTNAGKEAMSRAITLAAGRTIIGLALWEKANAMAGVLKAHPVAGPLVRVAGESEVSILWTEDGIRCKARIDRYVAGKIALDLKTTRCAAASAFGRSVETYGYHRQIAWYARGFRKVFGVDTPFVIVAQETEGDFEPQVFQVDAESIEAGNIDCDYVLRQYGKAIKSDEWPGYVLPETGKPGVVTVGISKYAKRAAGSVLTPSMEGGIDDSPF